MEEIFPDDFRRPDGESTQVSLELLQDGELLQIISYLSLWDAFALEATCKRFYDLVRSHQRAQRAVDVSFPLKKARCWRSNKKFAKNVKKLLSNRFGAKLKVVQWQGGDEFTPDLIGIEYTNRIAGKCPNLVVVPRWLNNITEAHAKKREASRITMLQLTNSRELILPNGRAITSCPALEELGVDCTVDGTSPSLTSWLTAPLRSRENSIRKLDFSIKGGPHELHDIKSVIDCCPKLTHFKLCVTFRQLGGYNLLVSVAIRDLFVMLQNRKCSTMLDATIHHFHSYIHGVENIRSFVDTLRAFILKNQVLAGLHNFTRLSNLDITLSQDPLVACSVNLPPSVQALSVRNSGDVGYDMDQFIEVLRSQGEHLRSFSIAIRREDDTVESVHSLLTTIAHCCPLLNQLRIQISDVVDCSATVSDFFRLRGNQIERFELINMPLVLDIVHMIADTSKSLRYMDIYIFEADFPLSSKKPLKKLLLGMSALYEARIKFVELCPDGNSFKSVTEYHYRNQKFAYYA